MGAEEAGEGNMVPKMGQQGEDETVLQEPNLSHAGEQLHTS